MPDPGDVDDLFGLGSPPPAPKAPARSGGIENRKEVRVRAKWQARVQLPDGRVIAMQTCDISETGLGLVGEAPITPNAVLGCALAIPDVNTPGRYTHVQGRMKTAHVTVRGVDLVYGGVWLELPADARDLIRRWVRKLNS